MTHKYYSLRAGTYPNIDGLTLNDTVDLFVRVYNQLKCDGYFDEAFGFYFEEIDSFISGTIKDIDLEILLKIRKKNLWPLSTYASSYTGDDFFDIIEFLYQNVSKPIDGTSHWETFNRQDGQQEFRDKINSVLAHYKKKYELSERGEILQKPDAGFELIFEADVPSEDKNIIERINSATISFRRHGSTIDTRRQAVRDLADVLEYLKPQVKSLINKKDEDDLFNIANNFGIRHHNDRQKTNYDAALWLSWMFYFYLSTIHVVLRKISHDKSKQ